MREILERLLDRCGRPVSVQRDESKLRASDPPRLVGTAARLNELTGWKPEIPIEQTLADLFDDWSDRLAADAPGR